MGRGLRVWVAAFCVAGYVALLVWAWIGASRLGDDGTRVQAVPRTGLLITAVAPGSPAAAQNLEERRAVIVSVEGVVSRDERVLLRVYEGRKAGGSTTLHVQGVTPGGGTGAGLGNVRAITMPLRPKLANPSLVIGLALTSMAGVVSIICAALGFAGVSAANVGARGGGPSTWGRVAAIALSVAVAGLMATRVLHAAAISVPLAAPILAAAAVASEALVLWWSRHWTNLIAAVAAALFGGAWLVLAAAPLSVDPRALLVAADAALAACVIAPLLALRSIARP